MLLGMKSMTAVGEREEKKREGKKGYENTVSHVATYCPC